MAINTNPIFTGLPSAGFSRSTGLSALASAYDVSTSTIGTQAFLLYTADATYGSFVQKLRWRALGTNVATVCRVFLNNGSAVGTATSNFLFDEMALAATTASASSATALYELPVNLALPPGWKIYIGYGTAVAAGYDVSAFAGNYSIPA